MRYGYFPSHLTTELSIFSVVIFYRLLISLLCLDWHLFLCSIFPMSSTEIAQCNLQPQKTRKVLAEKIAQLNSAIDDVSSQLKADDDLNEVALNAKEVEAAI